jgi:hypothetical protein
MNDHLRFWSVLVGMLIVPISFFIHLTKYIIRPAYLLCGHHFGAASQVGHYSNQSGGEVSEHPEQPLSRRDVVSPLQFASAGAGLRDEIAAVVREDLTGELAKITDQVEVSGWLLGLGKQERSKIRSSEH